MARDDAPRRGAAQRFAIGVAACQIGWLSLLVMPQVWPVAWLVLVPAELLVPVWAERAARTPFHPEHIAERYGLFMIIVLGESVLAASLAIQTILADDGLTVQLIGVILGCLLIVYAMWWIYFDRPEEHLLDSLPTAIVWSYMHLPIFAAVAAVGAGLVVAIEEAAGHAHLGWTGVGAAIAVPLLVFLISLWALYFRLIPDWFHRLTLPAAMVLILGAIFTPTPVLLIGVILAAMVALKIGQRLRTGPRRDG